MQFEVINSQDLQQAKSYLSWYSDPEMVNNWTVQRKDIPKQDYTIQNFQEDFKNSDKNAFMIKVDNKYIGYGSFYINHPVCMHKKGKVCWPSIAIGRPEYRGKGFGFQLCKEILKIAKELKCTHIEAGVFAFNKKMIRLLENNHFKLIGSREKFTFINNKWWDSNHYLLEL